jgi:hypothetical protein
MGAPALNTLKYTDLGGLSLRDWLAYGSEKYGQHAGVTIIKIPITAAQATAATNVETSTGVYLLYGMAVLDAWLNVTTADSGKTLDVGINSNHSGDSNGFIAAASLTSALMVYPGAAFSTQITAITRGALLCDGATGSGSDDRGMYIPKPYIVPASTSIDVTFTFSATSTAVVEIYLKVMACSPTKTVGFINSKENTFAAASTT